jgi:hypothetical protein
MALHTPEEHFITQKDFRPFAQKLDHEKENKVRKFWLISFFAYSNISVYNIFLALRDLSATSGSLKEHPEIGLYIHATLALLGIIPWFWVTHHCAYKKRGTGWLLWTLISLPIWEFPGLLISLQQTLDWNTLIWLMIGIIFWVNCIRLLKVNSAREFQKVLAFKNKYGPEANGFCC